MKMEKAVGIWLVVGIVMLYFQIVIGGVTRLTGSGLSITSWDIVTGVLPPMNSEQWDLAFDLYKDTPQYKKINLGMDLSEFKFIYFWEYIHRIWARLIGFVFLFPFVYFLTKKALSKTLIKDLLIVVFLAMLAATFGWIMVASGLKDRPWVNAYKLSIHLCIGVSVFSYLLWTWFKHRGFYVSEIGKEKIYSGFIKMLLVVVVVQFVFGGFMSGMKASLFYPTWPLIGTSFVPEDIFILSNWRVDNFINYDAGPFVFSVVHFIHRGLAYLILGLSLFHLYRLTKQGVKNTLLLSFRLFSLAVVIQAVLGIITLLLSVGQIPVLWGALHQGVGIVVLTILLWHLFVVIETKRKYLINQTLS